MFEIHNSFLKIIINTYLNSYILTFRICFHSKINLLILHLSSLLLIIFLIPHLFLILHILLQLKHMPHYSLILLHLQAHIINMHTFLLHVHMLLRILILINVICLFKNIFYPNLTLTLTLLLLFLLNLNVLFLLYHLLLFMTL